MAAAPVELWSTRLSCPQIHGRISSLPQQLPSATLGEPENPSLNSDPGCIKVVDTYRNAKIEGDLANLGPGFCIGHSFFGADGADVPLDEDWYCEIVESEIVPLLQEYWFDNPSD